MKKLLLTVKDIIEISILIIIGSYDEKEAFEKFGVYHGQR